jgi:TatD DNase family protein
MTLIDAHAHLSASSIGPVVDEVVSQLRVAGIRHVVLGGVDPADWGRQLDLAGRYPGFLTTSAGIHPWVVRDCEPAHLELMFLQLREQVAKFDLVGEVGFDFQKDHSASQKAKQIYWCEQQLELASSQCKPVVLHVVKGHDQMLPLLRGSRKLFGIVHAFTGSQELAEQYARLGFVISVGGRFFSSRHGKACAWLKEMPFVLETDGPWTAWPQHNSKLIAERWVFELRSTAKQLANAFGTSQEQVFEMSERNLTKILRKTGV